MPFSKTLIRDALGQELLCGSPDKKRLATLKEAFLDVEYFVSDEEFEKYKAIEKSRVAWAAKVGKKVEKVNKSQKALEKARYTEELKLLAYQRSHHPLYKEEKDFWKSVDQKRKSGQRILREIERLLGIVQK